MAQAKPDAGMARLESREAAHAWLLVRQARALAADSRRVGSGDAFIAWPGHASDGRQHVGAALAAGASACLVEADMELFESGASEDMALRGFMQSDVIVAWKNLRAFRRCLCRLRRAHGDTTPFEEPWRGGELPYPPTFVHEAA